MSNTETIPCIAGSSTACNAPMDDSEMAVQMVNIRVPELWNNEPALTMLETTKPTVTDRHAVDLPVSEEDDELPHENNKLLVTY